MRGSDIGTASSEREDVLPPKRSPAPKRRARRLPSYMENQGQPHRDLRVRASINAAASGGARDDAERENFFAMKTLMRSGWGQENPAFRQMFTSRLIPGGSKEQIDWLNELQRRTTSPECAARIFQSNAETDVTELLPQVTAPTLVMHARGDVAIPLQFGQQIAAGIPGAQFVVLQGQNHMFLEGDPATDRFFEELKIFLSK